MNKVVDKIWRKNCYFTIATAKDTPMTQNVSSFFLSFANEWLPCDKRTPCFLMGLYSPWLKWWLSTSTRTAHNGHLSHVVCSLYWRLLWLALRYDDFRHCDPGFLPKKKEKRNESMHLVTPIKKSVVQNSNIESFQVQSLSTKSSYYYSVTTLPNLSASSSVSGSFWWWVSGRSSARTPAARELAPNMATGTLSCVTWPWRKKTVKIGLAMSNRGRDILKWIRKDIKPHILPDTRLYPSYSVTYKVISVILFD